MTPILLLEINEIPWRLLDRYLGRPEFPHLNQFFEQSSHFTTLTVDVGELSPWVTWPTLHRGMSNEQHGIKNLGQDPSTFKGKPIWQEIRERGGSIGVCGSMQSWPSLEPGEGGFYVPDTFAHDERCHPAYLSPLQAFNLSQVRSNARVVSGSLPRATDVLSVAASSLKSGVTLRTGARIATQLFRERIDGSLTVRRPIFQTILFWDVFRRHFKAHRPPQLSTFFTNHVAGVMHRYWRDVFPEDFPEQTSRNGESHEWLMRFALGVLDDMLRDVLDWAISNPDLVVVFASSMGQDAVHRSYHEGMELVVEDLSLLMAQSGLSRSQYVPLLAMAPQVAVEIHEESLRAKARSVLEAAYCGDHTQFIRVQAIGPSLSITVATPPLKDMAADVFHIAGKQVKWTEAGIRKQDIEPGTAYHIPEGSLAVFSGRLRGSAPMQARPKVNADRIKDWLLAISKDGHSKIPLAHVSRRVKDKVALIANTAWYLYNFRRGLIKALQQQGYSVVAIAPPDEYAARLGEIGAEFFPMPMDNRGTNPLNDLRLTLGLRRLFKQQQPCCALTFTVKPNLFGTFAARSLGIPVVANISGLGTVFIKRSWVTLVVRLLYRGALSLASRVFFQNPDDLEQFVNARLVDRSRTQLIPGSGVDIESFAPPSSSTQPQGRTRFLLLGRLLWDKGIGEFADAAAQVREKFPNSEFVLMGFAGVDNATAIPTSKIEEWQKSGLMIFVPPQVDVRDQLAMAHCVVLPSYREGTPRSLLEAASMARPIIATDVPGCRQVVEDGVTGYLVRVRDARDLAEKMGRMIRLPESERAAMGMRGREKMVREFDERIVVREYMRTVEQFARGPAQYPIR